MIRHITQPLRISGGNEGAKSLPCLLCVKKWHRSDHCNNAVATEMNCSIHIKHEWKGSSRYLYTRGSGTIHLFDLHHKL